MGILQTFLIAMNSFYDFVNRLFIEIYRSHQGHPCSKGRNALWIRWIHTGSDVDFCKSGVLVDQFIGIAVIHVRQTGLAALEQLLQCRIGVYPDVYHGLNRAVAKCHRVL